MRALAVAGLGLVLFACDKAAPRPDGGLPHPVAERADEDRPPAPPTATAPSARLRDTDGGPPTTARGGGVLLCETHSVWRPPPGFVATRAVGGVVARKDGALVGLLFPPHGDGAYAKALGALVEGALVWDAPSMKRVDGWHAEATAYGRARGLTVVTVTLYAGVDPKTGEGRPGVAVAAGGSDVVWVAAAPTQTEADTLLAGGRAGYLALVDHACACGYDCPRRP